ncbi:MAG: sugar kinase [Elusimicrobia bacterium]|nr:sugar kinase [Elusimicrobiota bacterium]
MGIVVVGSVALDVISTPKINRRRVLGGSAVYSALSLSTFTNARLVGVVGEDFPADAVSLLEGRGVDLGGLERKAGLTFSWEGEYTHDLSEAKTLSTNLNVFAEFSPKLPQGFLEEDVVFLGNIDPDLQADVLTQMKSPRLVAADTIDHWLSLKPEALRKLLAKVHVFFLNEKEAKRFSGESKVLRAARAISAWGPRLVVIKSGEHGAMAYDSRTGQCFWSPAFPAYEVVDPTGAGDSFAGGFLGTMAAEPEPFRPALIKKALSVGNVMSSFAISALSVEGLLAASREEIERRLDTLMSMAPEREATLAALIAQPAV